MLLLLRRRVKTNAKEFSCSSAAISLMINNLHTHINKTKESLSNRSIFHAGRYLDDRD